MKIDASKLKKLVKKPDGAIEAQCPACEAAGHDTTGNHLIVYPDSRFGCVANPKDTGHNKKILEMVGTDQPESMPAPTITMRPYRALPSKKLCVVPRRTLQELRGRAA